MGDLPDLAEHLPQTRAGADSLDEPRTRQISSASRTFTSYALIETGAASSLTRRNSSSAVRAVMICRREEFAPAHPADELGSADRDVEPGETAGFHPHRLGITLSPL